MDQTGVSNWRQYPSWVRGPAQIVEDEVVLDETRADQYHLFEPTDLLFDLADVAADPSKLDPQNVLSFVRRYGLLWHGAEDLGSGKCREPLSEWWDESYTVAAIADLYVRLKEAARTNSAEPLRTAPIKVTDFFEGGDSDYDQVLMEGVSLSLAETISMKLQGCDLGIVSSLGIDVERRGLLPSCLHKSRPTL